VTSQDCTFHLHRCIGRGGFGEVYHATMTRPDGSEREVAVKVLHPGIDPSAQAIQRLRDEGRLLGVLRHPSIIGVVDMLMIQGRLALVTEYVDGEDLSSCFQALPPPSPRAMVEIVGRVASALDAAWRTPSPDGDGQLRLIHRDIKPPNIRISRLGEVKLLDFGLAHADGAEREAHTADHSLLGSFLYMAPERYLQQPATTATDAFGLGCCLYEGLRGEKLFEGFKPVDLYALLIEKGQWDRTMTDRLAEIPSTVDPRARDLCRALLCQTAEERLTVTQLADSWEDLVAGMSGPTLQRWVSTRTWGAPERVETDLEGSVVEASAVLDFAPPAGERFSDQVPTVAAHVEGLKALSALATEPRGIPAAYLDDETTTVDELPPGIPQTPPPVPRHSRSVPPRSGGYSIVWASVFASLSTTVALVAAVVVLLVLWSALGLGTASAPPAPPVAAAPAPTPEPVDVARVEVEGALSAQLKRGSRTVPVGDVPPGTWALWVDFGDGLTRVGSLRVMPDQRVVVPCDAATTSCQLPKRTREGG
jgi:serine/threonine protein kinase